MQTIQHQLLVLPDRACFRLTGDGARKNHLFGYADVPGYIQVACPGVDSCVGLDSALVIGPLVLQLVKAGYFICTPAAISFGIAALFGTSSQFSRGMLTDLLSEVAPAVGCGSGLSFYTGLPIVSNLVEVDRFVPAGVFEKKARLGDTANHSLLRLASRTVWCGRVVWLALFVHNRAKGESKKVDHLILICPGYARKGRTRESGLIVDLLGGGSRALLIEPKDTATKEASHSLIAEFFGGDFRVAKLYTMTRRAHFPAPETTFTMPLKSGRLYAM